MKHHNIKLKYMKNYESRYNKVTFFLTKYNKLLEFYILNYNINNKIFKFNQVSIEA